MPRLDTTAPPNTALQRTRSAPLRSPLKRKTFGARGATVKVDATDEHPGVVPLQSRGEWAESKLREIDVRRSVAGALSQSRPMAAQLDIMTFLIDEEEEET